MAKESVIAELLPILDDINRALGHVPKELEKNAWAVGISQIAKQAEGTLANLGVEVITAKGEVFNPEMHEAVSFEDGQGDIEVVVEEIRPGYQIGNRVLRPSMVRVGKRSK